MANFKKMDELDFYFVNKPLTKKDDKEFSDFLKSRKTKSTPKAKAKHNSIIATKNRVGIITTFDEHLDSRYGEIGTMKRTEFEIKAKTFAIGEVIKEEKEVNCTKKSYS